ncbi:hypothetical protein ACHAWF_014279, partial [Thalassiosira exigua]
GRGAGGGAGGATGGADGEVVEVGGADDDGDGSPPSAPPSPSSALSPARRSGRARRATAAAAAASSASSPGRTRGGAKGGGRNGAKGGGRGKSGANGKGGKDDRPRLGSDPASSRALAEARYEAYVDPHRGAYPYFAAIHDGGDADEAGEPSPWAGCANAVTSLAVGAGGEEGEAEVVDVDADEGDSTKDDGALLVRCGCPTVDAWAAEEYAAYEKARLAEAKKRERRRGKKRKAGGGDDGDDGNSNGNGNGNVGNGRRICCGERSADPTVLHPCDFNPFCLASLGGSVDRFRRRKAEETYGGSETATANCEDGSQSEGLGAKEQQNGNGDVRQSILVNREGVLDHLSRYLCRDNDDPSACLDHIVRLVHGPLLCCPQLDPVVKREEDAFGENCNVMAMGAAVNSNMVVKREADAVGENSHANVNKATGPNGRIELSAPPGLRNLGATCYLNSQLQCLAQNLGLVRGLLSWQRGPAGSGSGGGRMSAVLSNLQSVLARMRDGPDRVICTKDFAESLCLENDEMQDPNEFARLLFDRMQDSFRQSADSRLGGLLPSVFGGTTMYVTQCSECGNKSVRREDFMDLLVPIAEPGENGASSVGQRGGAAAQRDTDIQQCIDAYLHPESLEGDNRYECMQCRKKCDATRSMKFAKLPPVLNIQLARYIFDMKTLSKRKLATKVLLPQTLEIPSNCIDWDSAKHGVDRYILCAVQNHLGTSAHGGHYVADVMDWTTGVWHEFNDDEITMLDGGPAASFDPSDVQDGSKTKPGSGDAYNIFYVKQSYLTAQCLDELEHVADYEPPNLSDTGDILASIKTERKEKYRLELEMQTQNKLKRERIKFRQEQIANRLLTDSGILTTAKSNESRIWMDSTFLRRFFSFKDGLEDVFGSASKSLAALRYKSFSCAHSKGLHPRVFRQGKLVSNNVCGIIESIMRDEYAMFLHDQALDQSLSANLSLFDNKIVEGNNLTCDDCGLEYQREARQKYDLLQTMISAHDDLLPGENDLAPSDIVDPSKVYAISRTFVTSFKKFVEKKVNELQHASPKKSSQDGKSNCCGGIDKLDLSEVCAATSGDACDQKANGDSKKSTEKSDAFKGEDPTSKICCEHKKCPLMHKGKSVRLISADVWQKMLKLFPKAIPHQFEFARDEAIGNCMQCQSEKEEETQFPQHLMSWKNKITQGETLSELFKRGTMELFYPAAFEELLQNPGAHFMAVACHHLDVQRWRECKTVVEKAIKSRRKNKCIREHLNELLFVTEESPEGRAWKFRPLVCDHWMTVGLPALPESGDVRGYLEELRRLNIELLLREEYHALEESLSNLEEILHGCGSAPLEAARVPEVSVRCGHGSRSIAIDPTVCVYNCSMKIFSDEIVENGMVVPKSHQSQRSVEEVEIIDESPKGPLCKIVVHEVEGGDDVEVAASQILADAAQSDDAPQLSATGRPRRSQKARGGGFPVYEIKMALDGNLAHLRLLLHQSKSKKLYGQQLFLMHTGSVSAEATGKLTRELTYSHNLDTLQEITSGLPSNNESIQPEQQKDCNVHMILTYTGDRSGKAEGRRASTRKRISREEKDEEDNLQASLTEVQCGGWKTADGEIVTGGKKSKKRRQERGFQGTFLSSMSNLEATGDPPGEQSAAVQEFSDTHIEASKDDVAFETAGLSQKSEEEAGANLLLSFSGACVGPKSTDAGGIVNGGVSDEPQQETGPKRNPLPSLSHPGVPENPFVRSSEEVEIADSAQKTVGYNGPIEATGLSNGDPEKLTGGRSKAPDARDKVLGEGESETHQPSQGLEGTFLQSSTDPDDPPTAQSVKVQVILDPPFKTEEDNPSADVHNANDDQVIFNTSFETQEDNPSADTHLETEEDNESADADDVNNKPAEGALDRKISKAMEAMSEIVQGDSSWLKEEILSTFADPNSEGAAVDVVLRQKLMERVHSKLQNTT